MNLVDLGVTDKVQAKLAKLHIHNVWDAVLHLPLRYEDETHITMIADAKLGESVQVEGEVLLQEVQFKPRKQLVVKLQDDAGSVLMLRFIQFLPQPTTAIEQGQARARRG